MKLFHVDREKCVKCGACADVCPTEVIILDQDGPKERRFTSCISCGHCVAVCPVSALDNVRAPLKEQVMIDHQNLLNVETAYQFLRSRRSIRCYKQEQVPKEKLLRIIDIAHFAPTAGNTQGLSFLVISDKEKLRRLSAATIEWMEQEVSSGSVWSRYYKAVIQTFRRTGKDVILRDAPHLIVALSSKDFNRGQENAHFALAYAELLAPTLGIGTCWAGFFQTCGFSGYAALLDIIDIPSDKMLSGALMAGYPKYTYHRLVDRNPLEVSWQ